jgi:nitroreductase
MATDIVDKDLKKLRNDRWDAVFASDSESCEAGACNTRRTKVLKATIIIEHLIQASDVSHTMQHWHIYRRWNERFFLECYQAYLDGRAEKNPAKTWYKGEIGFFDFYIIPLAKKLKECGVFGVSSDEYLSYALQNRKEWEERGEEMVKEMVKEARRRDLAAQRRAVKAESK